ncbi:MAG TPA: hypothetical protein VNZ03_07320 [Terriglobales bacterium]|nr:hypothetical protein [Terriglobales bacterium]
MSTPNTVAFHCSAEWHLAKLGKYPGLVHALILRIQTEERDFFGSNDQIAEYFGADEKTVRRVLDVLVDTGFVEVIEERVGESTIYRALTHKEWAAKYPSRCCVKREKNPSQSLGVPKGEPLPIIGSTLSQPQGGHPSQSFPEPLPMTGTQVSEEVSEAVSEGVPKGSSGRENSANSLSVAPRSLSLQRKPSSKENPRRLWAHRIWTVKTGRPLNVRKTDTAHLERFITEHGEDKAARAWWEYVNSEQCLYNLDPVEIVIKGQGKNGKEWLESAEDESKVTQFPLAAFFAVADGYLVAAETPTTRARKAVDEAMLLKAGA